MLNQTEKDNDIKIAYSGIKGAFAYNAAKRLYPNAELVACKNFREAYETVERKECYAAILPVENSYAGEVGQVTDLLFFGDLVIDKVCDVKVDQNLLGIKGAKESDIKKVISHPQALSQCENYILSHDIEQEGAVNTAIAAKRVAKMNDKSIAAIASVDAAEIYGLDILRKDINESVDNTTRFGVFKHKDSIDETEEKNGFILLFTVPHIAGGLAKAINIVGEYGFNMNNLRSRPMKSLAWKYYFYVEAEGDITSEYGREMMARLSFWCDTVKIAGRYSTNS